MSLILISNMILCNIVDYHWKQRNSIPTVNHLSVHLPLKLKVQWTKMTKANCRAFNRNWAQKAHHTSLFNKMPSHLSQINKLRQFLPLRPKLLSKQNLMSFSQPRISLSRLKVGSTHTSSPTNRQTPTTCSSRRSSLAVKGISSSGKSSQIMTTNRITNGNKMGRWCHICQLLMPTSSHTNRASISTKWDKMLNIQMEAIRAQKTSTIISPSTTHRCQDTTKTRMDTRMDIIKMATKSLEATTNRDEATNRMVDISKPGIRWMVREIIIKLRPQTEIKTITDKSSVAKTRPTRWIPKSKNSQPCWRK